MNVIPWMWLTILHITAGSKKKVCCTCSSEWITQQDKNSGALTVMFKEGTLFMRRKWIYIGFYKTNKFIFFLFFYNNWNWNISNGYLTVCKIVTFLQWKCGEEYFILEKVWRNDDSKNHSGCKAKKVQRNEARSLMGATATSMQSKLYQSDDSQNIVVVLLVFLRVSTGSYHTIRRYMY